jgi:ABC-2 type transport system permease protein
MFRVVMSLRIATTRHQLRRDWWRVLFLVGGIVWSISLVPAVLWAARVLSYNDAQTKAEALVLVAGVLLAGWVIVPLLVTGLDDSLDPGRFASLGIGAKQLARPLAVTTLLTVPALFFLFVLAGLSTSWRTEHPKPWPLVVGLVGAVLTWLAMVFSARVAAAWAARVLGSRRSREAALVAAVVALGLIAPAVWVVIRDGLDLVLEYDLRVLMRQLAVTPIGAGMAAPRYIVDGEPWQAAWRIAMMLAWVALLVRAWRANVAHSLVHPIFRGGGTRRRDDSILVAGERAARRASAPLARLRGSGAERIPRAAVRARLSHYWFSDPRYLSNLAGVLVVPLIVAGLIMPLFGLDARWSFAAPVLLAATIGWGRHNDVAYDSSALWLDVASGRLGTAVTRGRIGAVLMWAAPMVLVVALAALAWTRMWELTPAVLGACAGVLGSTLGVSAITSVAFPYRAPGPGESPFGAEVGSVGAGLFAQFMSSLITFIVIPASIIPLVLAVAVDARWGWAATVVGLASGAVVYLIGVRVAGIIYDRRSGDLIGLVT